MTQELKRDEIVALVTELDAKLPKENAFIGMHSYGADEGESFIQGSHNGYLRFGVEFLKGALASGGKEETEISIDIGYLLDDESDVHFDYFKQSNKRKPPQYEQTWKDEVFIYGVIALLVLILIFSVVGLVASLRYALGWALS